MRPSGRAFHTGKTPQLRIVPVNKQIAIERGVTTYDRIRAHIEASPGPFGTLRCICRHGHDLLGRTLPPNPTARQLPHDRASRAVGGGVGYWAGGNPRTNARPARPGGPRWLGVA